VRIPLLLFAAGLLLRLLFWQATPDRDLAYAIAYQGDAPVWQQEAIATAAMQARGIASTGAAALPFRPPGMSWLVQALWNGDPGTAWRLRLLFVVLGAAVAPLCWLLLRAPFGGRVAVLAATLTGLATNVVLLGSGLHSELPYLLLALLGMLDWERLRTAPAVPAVLRFSCLQAICCLFRADHALCYLLLLAALWWQRPPRRLRTSLLSAVVFAATLLPWQLHAWSAVTAFNTRPLPALPLPGALAWTPAALARVRTLPAFQQQPVFRFVDATVRVRGGNSVSAEDLGIIEQAYGWWPEPLPPPFVAVYGPLNFFLGNSPEAGGAFANAALGRPPLLLGGAARYPPGLVLPDAGQPSFDYPPHLQAMVHGYALGWQWLVAHPGEAARLWWRKLEYFWQGAASGIGGYALPIGLSGERRRVDLVTASGPFATAFRLLLLAAAATGLWRVRRTGAVTAWFAWLLAKLAAVLLFFGYARLGALCVPVVALGVAVTCVGLGSSRHNTVRPVRLGFVLPTVVLGLELIRWLSSPAPTVDGRSTTGGDPFAADAYAVRQVRY